MGLVVAAAAAVGTEAVRAATTCEEEYAGEDAAGVAAAGCEAVTDVVGVAVAVADDKRTWL